MNTHLVRNFAMRYEIEPIDEFIGTKIDAHVATIEIEGEFATYEETVAFVAMIRAAAKGDPKLTLEHVRMVLAEEKS